MHARNYLYILVVLFLSFICVESANSAETDMQFRFGGKNHTITCRSVKKGIADKEFKIQVFKGINILYRSIDRGAEARFLIAQNFFGPGNDGVVAIIESGGSGGNIDWYILGEVAGSFGKVFGKTGIFQGEIKITGTVFEEWISGRKTAYAYSKGGIHKIDAKEPDPDMTTVELGFRVEGSGKVFLDAKGFKTVETARGTEARVNMGVNQTLRLLHLGGGPDVRFLLQNDGFLKKVSPSGWQAVRPGTTYINIIPGGYDEKKLVLVVKIHK